MATANQTSPATVRPIPLAAKLAPVPIACEAVLKNCNGRFGTCRWSFKVGSGFVPDIATLYEQARKSGIATFGYAESQTATTLLAISTGVRRRP